MTTLVYAPVFQSSETRSGQIIFTLFPFCLRLQKQSCLYQLSFQTHCPEYKLPKKTICFTDLVVYKSSRMVTALMNRDIQSRMQKQEDLNTMNTNDTSVGQRPTKSYDLRNRIYFSNISPNSPTGLHEVRCMNFCRNRLIKLCSLK